MLDALGKYQIIDQVGKGSMGVVYKARDPHIGRIVALKTLLLPYSSTTHDIELINRLRQEAQAAGRLMHPNIVVIYEYGEDGDTAYIAMAYVEGRELKSYLDNEERFSLDTVCNIMQQILSALQYSHVNDITHRDIKPSNIMMMPNGHVMVTDFGIARLESSELTQVGTAIGTPSYMSPEQCMGQRVDGRSDIFSAGIILYQLLTGEKPFDGPSVASILHKIVQVDPVPPSELNVTVPKALDGILQRCLAKAPDDRFATAEEFSTTLQQVLGKEGLASSGNGGGGLRFDRPSEIPVPEKQGEPVQTAENGDDEETVALSLAEAVDVIAVDVQPEDNTIMLSDVKEVGPERAVHSQQHSFAGSVGGSVSGHPDEADEKKMSPPLRKVLLYLVPVLFFLIVSISLKVILSDTGGGEGGSGQPVNAGGMVELKKGTSPEGKKSVPLHQEEQKQQASGEVREPAQHAIHNDESPVGQGDGIQPVTTEAFSELTGGEGEQEVVEGKVPDQQSAQGEVPVTIDETSQITAEAEGLEVVKDQGAASHVIGKEGELPPASDDESKVDHAVGVGSMEVVVKESVQLHSVPEGVAVVIEAMDIHEVTPAVLQLGPGLHQVYLSKSGFHDMSIVVSVKKEEQVALTVPMDPL